MRDYAARPAIEPMFSDFKGRGFKLEDSQLGHADRLERLLLVMSLAMHWCVRVGKALWGWKRAITGRLAEERLALHEAEAQVLPTRCGIPWLGFVVHPTHRLLKRRNAVNFTRKLEHLLDLYQAGQINFAELDASVQGWINPVRYADTWGLREHVFAGHPLR